MMTDEDLEIPWVEVPEQHAAPEPVRQPAVEARTRLRVLTSLTQNIMDEGIRQYAVSIAAGTPMLRTFPMRFADGMRGFGSFLAQPVWVPGRKKTVKQHSRGTLFLIDIVRFGGTFAGIFGVLFLALNFQSFWQIAQAQLEHVLAGPSISISSEEQNAVTEQLADEARQKGDLMAYLPNVGPPSDRIVIPKLNLNIPLVTPSYDSLLRQDWTKVEEDIQHALQDGVVHYPGTARPGQAGNFFVTGHSSYYPWAPGAFKTVFARLHELEPGDEYTVYYKGDKHRYIVRGEKEVLPSDVTVLDQPKNRRIATLMTCTPIGTTLRRLIITAEEVDVHTGLALKVGERSDDVAAPAVQLEALPI